MLLSLRHAEYCSIKEIDIVRLLESTFLIGIMMYLIDAGGMHKAMQVLDAWHLGETHA